MAAPEPQCRGVSGRRIALALVPLLILVIAGAAYQVLSFRKDTRLRNEQTTLLSFGLARPTQNRLDQRFTDKDGDLVADPVADPAAQIDPDPIMFAYIGGQDAEGQGKVWQGLVDHLSMATGRTVETTAFASTVDQLEALSEGRLHVAGLNTGSVPTAVNACGFVPCCTLGREDGSYGYTMQIIVPQASVIKKVAGLRGHKLMFSSRLSNSGFKAPVVLLMSDFGLLPERDYSWGFTRSHNESIGGVAAGHFEAAPVASDMVDRAVARGEIRADQIRSLYTSERFPPAALGYIHNLKPDLASSLRAALLSFEISGSALESELSPAGVTQLVPVSYKNDWAVIRRVDDAMGHVHQVR